MRALLCILLFLSSASAAPLPAVKVFPDGPTIPASLLRISLKFAERPAGEVLPRLKLTHDNGEPIALPFLEQELWSADGRLLTVLLHPGRVKNGLVARAEQGPVIDRGASVALRLDGQIVKRWMVVAADTTGPVPAKWRIAPGKSGTHAPMIVQLDGEIDRGGLNLLAVIDARRQRVAGTASLSAGGSQWLFTPKGQWHAGRYYLAVHPQLEDPSGNRLNSSFELPSTAGRPEEDGQVIAFQVTGMRGNGLGHVR